MKMTKAFTMIKLIFIIVVLGILSAVALPRFQGVRDQADIATGKAQVATIRAAIANERQRRLILGDSSYITNANLSADGLFSGVLTTPLTNSNTASNWNATAAQITAGTYFYNVGGTNTQFDYNSTDGSFDCTEDANDCNALTNRD